MYPDDAYYTSYLGASYLSYQIIPDMLVNHHKNKYDFGAPVFNLSVYNKGCFIENHRDGYDNDDKRLCVLLLYLNIITIFLES